MKHKVQILRLFNRSMLVFDEYKMDCLLILETFKKLKMYSNNQNEKQYKK